MFPNRRKSKLSGVECRSELDTSWQRPRSCRYDRESYQLRPRFQQPYWFQHLQFVVVAVVVLNLLQLVAGSPVFMNNNPNLAQFQTGRNIRHLPCVVRKSGRSGVCMFAIDCIKANGTHLGTCIDRFYFGSCCQTHDVSVLLDQEISDNSIDQNTISHYKHESTTLSTSDLFKITAPTTSLKTTSPKTTSTTTPATSSTGSSVQEQITTSIYNITISIKDANSTIVPIYSKPRPTVIGTSTEIIIDGISTPSSSSTSSITTITKSPITTMLPPPKTTTSTLAITTTPEIQTESDIVTTTLSVMTTTNLPKTEAIQTTTIPTKVTTFQIVQDELTTIVPSTSPPRIATPPTVLPTFLPPPRRPTRRPTLPTTTTKKPPKKTTPKVRPTLPPVNSIHTDATKKPIRTTTYRPSATTTRKTTNKRPGTKRPSSTNKKPPKRPGTTYPTVSPPKRPTNKPTTKKPITTTKKPTTTTKRPATTTAQATTSTSATTTTTQAPKSTTMPPKAPRPTPKPTAEIVKVPVTLATDTLVQKDSEDNTIDTTEISRTTLNLKPATYFETIKSTTVPSFDFPEQTLETTTSSFELPVLTTIKADSTTIQPESSSLITTTINSSTSTSISSTSSAPLPSTTAAETTIPSVTTTPTTTTSTTPVPPPKTSVTSPALPEDTTVPPTSTVAEPITLTTTTSTSTTTTTPTPTTTASALLESTTLRPGLVTWTNMDDMPTNLSVFNGTNEEIWSPVPPPDWIQLATISPTAVSADSDSSKPPVYADEFITDVPEVMYPSTSAPTSTSSPSSASSVPATSSEEAPTTMADSISFGAQTPGDLLENATSPAMPVSTDSTTESFPSSSASSEQMILNSTTASTNVSSSTYPPVSFEGIDYKQICGKRMFPEPRIVGGSNAAFGRWPWQISLRQWRTSTYLHKCGAALLNENWAITAAHCVDNVPPSDLLLRLGEYDLAEEEEPYGYQERRVQIVASHPQFDPRTFEYDLALLRFYEPVAFQPNIIPVCVPGDDTDFIGQTAYVTGWGRLYEDGPLPSVLQEVSVPVINNTICETMYRSAGYIEHIPHIFICAGWKKGGYDSCEGDSGGPMVLQREDKRFLLGGVISWGIGCAEPNQPGVYTRISEFRDWINQILQF